MAVTQDKGQVGQTVNEYRHEYGSIPGILGAKRVSTNSNLALVA